MSRWPENYDEEDCVGDIPYMSEEMGDLIAEERAQREADELCDPEKINAAIESIRPEWEVA